MKRKSPQTQSGPARAAPTATRADVREAAHELSNAVGAILGWAELAEREVQSGKHQSKGLEKALKHILASARSARVWSQLALDPNECLNQRAEVIDVSDVLTELAERFEPMAKAAKIELLVDIAPGLRMEGSAQALESVVWNLVKNGLEATRPKGKVAIRAERSDSANLIISVSDTGRGIEPKALGRIFERDFTTKRNGHGVGLSFVKKVVSDLGGAIVPHSEHGKGTHFSIELPICRDGQSRSDIPSKRVTAEISLDLSDLRILVVDDDLAVRELVTTALELRGAIVHAPSTISEVHRLTKEAHTFDVAVLDLTLGDERGDALLAELREKGIVTRALMISGMTAPAKVSLHGKPDRWLRKPFDLEELVLGVRSVVYGASSPLLSANYTNVPAE